MHKVTTSLLLAASLIAAIPVAAHAVCCILPYNAQGTVDMPANCPNGYLGHMEIVDGFLPGNTIQIDAALVNFINLVVTPGGFFPGGLNETWNCSLPMQMTGTGAYASYTHNLTLAMAGQSNSGPRPGWAPLQIFPVDLYSLQGVTLTDPDFDFLRVTAGTGMGLPSPGNTTLTASGSGLAVDSFFDITYRIDFIGKPGGPFAGCSGSTTRQWRFAVCPEPATPARQTTWGTLKALYR